MSTLYDKTTLQYCSVFFRALLFILLAATSTISLADPTVPAPIRFLLTFDDGPSGDHYNNTTEQVLEVLAKNDVQSGVKAIFFIQTRAARGGGTEVGRQLIKREWDEGHLPEFHSATRHHDNHRTLSEEEFKISLRNGIADLKAITGIAPTIVRPPFWSYDLRTFTTYQSYGLHMMLTDLSANDGKIWGVNFSFHKHSNLFNQLGELRPHWQAGELPVVDGYTPIIVTFHDVNSYTSNHVEVYMQILLQVAHELNIPTAPLPFYNRRDEIERAALARTVQDGSVRQKLPGFWDWLWN